MLHYGQFVAKADASIPVADYMEIAGSSTPVAEPMEIAGSSTPVTDRTEIASSSTPVADRTEIASSSTPVTEPMEITGSSKVNYAVTTVTLYDNLQNVGGHVIGEVVNDSALIADDNVGQVIRKDEHEVNEDHEDHGEEEEKNKDEAKHEEYEDKNKDFVYHKINRLALTGAQKLDLMVYFTGNAKMKAEVLSALRSIADTDDDLKLDYLTKFYTTGE